jgi:predicted RNA-binding Zn-ribbon protein involved in translation (DUF1610 family)
MRIFALLVYVAGIAACVYFLGGTPLTPRESALLSVILTILSILATWTVSHLYSESQHAQAIKEVQEFHRTNLKTYARKAAEKVNNLSNELSRLSAYLEKELATTDYDHIQEELNAKEERIESAIHIINALKSVNDTALSDWEGVIGDELDKQREEKAETEQELENLLSNYETALTSLQANLRERGENTHSLQTEIGALRRDMRFLTARVTGIPLSLAGFTPKRKQTATIPCPNCETPVTFKVKKKPGAIKPVECKNCSTKLIARSDQEGVFSLELRKPSPVNLNCPSCTTSCEIAIDPLPGSILRYNCPNCKKEMRILTTKKGVLAKIVSTNIQVSPPPKKAELDETIIDLIRQNLPPQPWPKGVHKHIATKLGLTDRVVRSAINTLIRRGVFNPQVDGKLYVPASTLKQ